MMNPLPPEAGDEAAAAAAAAVGAPAPVYHPNQQRVPVDENAAADVAVAPLQNPVPIMERVLYNLHHRCCCFALNHTSRLSRSRAEHSVLVVGFLCFGALFLVHSTFVHHSGLRSTCLPSIETFDMEADLTRIYITDEVSSRVVHSHKEASPSTTFADRSASYFSGGNSGNTPTDYQMYCQQEDSTCQNAMSPSSNQTDASPCFSFAREKAYLFYSPELAQRHGIRVQDVYVSKSDDNCFGEPFVQYLVYILKGYDTVVMNWLLGTFSTTGTTTAKGHPHLPREGYIFNHRTREHPTDIRSGHFQLFPHHEINRFVGLGTHGSNNGSGSSGNSQQRFVQWFFRKLEELLLKGVIVIKTSFLFFITTKLVSFTLRETQGRMLDFTHHLEECFRDRSPLSTIMHLVTTHVVENLVFVPVMVGMIFFLINFYRGDMFLAFLVLSLVWVCESLSLVGLRTEKGIQYFPLFFFLLFAVFHYYYISFPWGFSYAALSTSMFFMLHSMLFFWHRYELPAVAMGLVNPDHPRQYAPPPPPPLQQHPVNLAPQPQPMEHDRYISDVRGGQAARYPYQPVLEQPHLSFPTMHQDAHLQPPPSYVRSHVRRTLSFNTTTSGAFSRNSSNAGMHQRNNDYEDDDGSMQFYVGGEVVVPSSHHRGERTRVPSSLNVPSYVTNETTDGPIGTSAAPQTTQADEQQRRPSYSTWNSRNERYMGGLETLVASAVSADEDSVQFVRTPMGSHDNSAPTSPMAPIADPSQQPEATGRSRIEDTNANVGVYSETSALHAILINGMNEADSSLALHPETTTVDSTRDDDSLPALPPPSTIFR